MHTCVYYIGHCVKITGYRISKCICSKEDLVVKISVFLQSDTALGIVNGKKPVSFFSFVYFFISNVISHLRESYLTNQSLFLTLLFRNGKINFRL